MRTLAATFRRAERRATRAALVPLLWRSLSELEHGSAGLPDATFLAFLSELALAVTKFRKGSREQRRALRRIVFQPRAADAEFLSVLLRSHLQGVATTAPILPIAAELEPQKAAQ